MPGFNYKLIRSKRKTTAIEITKGCEIIIRAPLFQSQKTIENFIREKSAWIEKALKKQSLRQDKFSISEQEAERLKALAKKIIPQKVEYFSSLTGLVPTAVKITSAKTRFGSCSGKNSICFSFYLMQYPHEAIDYVVLHEIIHIKHHNHSKRFWNELEKHMPDYKKRRQLLK